MNFRFRVSLFFGRTLFIIRSKDTFVFCFLFMVLLLMTFVSFYCSSPVVHSKKKKKHIVSVEA
jgi:hypothetical protein